MELENNLLRKRQMTQRDYQATLDKALYQPTIFPQDTHSYSFTVSIILRTKDRPICLPRAINSILNQRFQDWQLVIVNDGGNVEIFEAAISQFKSVLENRLIVIHHDVSKGMSRGLNVAIDASSSQYIVVHDDDDTWDINFLFHTVNFLKDAANADCCGVATHANRVVEEIINDQFIERLRNDFNSKDNPFTRVSLYRLMMQNTFTTNSFLFKRNLINLIGYFNEDLPVLNDWDFNLRCAFRYEIGMIPMALVNYHHRVAQNKQANYGNSIIETGNLCLQYETVIRNRWLRTMLNSEAHAPLIGMCFAQGGQELENSRLPEVIDGVSKKIDVVTNNQQLTLSWIEKKICVPLGQDLSLLQNHILSLHKKIDMLTEQA